MTRPTFDDANHRPAGDPGTTREPAGSTGARLFGLGLAMAMVVAPAGLAAQVGTPVDSAAAEAAADSLAGDAAAPADTVPAGPRSLTPDDYGQWERLGRATLSPGGDWMAYDIGRVNDEDELRIRPLDGTADSLLVIDYGSRPTFSGDGRWLAFTIGVSEDERESLVKRKETPENGMGLLDLATGDTTQTPGVSSFAFSDDGRYLAMRRYPAGRAEGDDEHGADLVVRELATGIDANFGNVGEFGWQDDGRLLAMTVDAADNAGNGVRVWDPADGTLRVLDSEPAEYRELRWRADHDDLSVLRAFEDEDREEDGHVLLAWRDVDGRTRAFRLDPREYDGFPADTRVVDFRAPEFSDDGRAIFFGTREWELTEEALEKAEGAAGDEADGEAEPAPDAEGGGPESESASTSEGEDEEKTAGVEVWHSRDVDIIPRQKVRAGQDRRAHDLAVWHLDDDRVVPLGLEARDATRVHGDRVVLERDETPYERERMFGPAYEDLYLVDVATGERQRIKERVQYVYGPSPGGRYILYLDDDHFRVYDIDRGRHVNLTAGIPTVFVDTADDHTVAQKPPFRPAGWTEGDRRVVLHDRYDAWLVAPDGSGGERLTDGAADSVVHRYTRVGWDEDQEAIDPGDPAYYDLTGEWSKRNGYAVADRLGRRPERRIWADARVGWLEKADEADVFVYQVEDFADSPDYFLARGRLADGEQVTETNPFQADYHWGRSELIEFENAWGKRLQGALFYPADYEPGRQYPMITYIYEIRSPAVHSYYEPSERSAYNPAVWTSQGYFVFQPDIVYRDRNPGLSAVEALVPAVEAVLETGMVDPERVGLVGHSWGGYQTAFVPTQTDLFAAAVAGAPLTELTSMYLSIYWNSGGTDARIFEISQGRMEVPPWEDLDSYHANSPVHNIESLNTPMLVAFGDEDGAVDWDQGIVFYNAARRAGKDLVLLVYEGENHGLRQEENQIDYHRRINQWFAHYLKGEPAPEWMTTGVPFLDQEDGKAIPE